MYIYIYTYIHTHTQIPRKCSKSEVRAQSRQATWPTARALQAMGSTRGRKKGRKSPSLGLGFWVLGFGFRV